MFRSYNTAYGLLAIALILVLSLLIYRTEVYYVFASRCRLDAPSPEVSSASACQDEVKNASACQEEVKKLRRMLTQAELKIERLNRGCQADRTVPPPVQQVGGSLFTTVELVKLAEDKSVPNGWRWPVPAATDRLYIEIGANNRNTMDEETLPKEPHAFLLTFEPLLGAYSELISRYSKEKDKWRPLGWHHKRGIVLPVAIAPRPERRAIFNLAPVDGCSSLLEKSGYGAKWCSETNERRSVPTMTLQRVLELLPHGRQVDLLNVDAQGTDIQVVESAGPLLHLVRRAKLEVTLEHRTCGGYYVNSTTCSGVMRKMASFGFYAHSAHTLNIHYNIWRLEDCREKLPCPQCCEIDITFARVG